MSHTVRRLVCLIGFWLMALPAYAVPDAPHVPAALTDWVPWVLEKHPEQTCPFQYAGKFRLCDAPSALRLTLDDSGGTFELNGYAFKAGWVVLLGDAFYWS